MTQSKRSLRIDDTPISPKRREGLPLKTARRFLFLVLILAASTSKAEDNGRVPLLVLLDQQRAPQVAYFGPDYNKRVGLRVLGQAIGIAMVGGDVVSIDLAGPNSVYKKENAKYGERLNSHLEGFDQTRFPSLSSSLTERFEIQGDVFSLDIRSTAEAQGLIIRGRPDYESSDIKRFRYVLVIDEFTGLSTPSLSLGQLSPFLYAQASVYDVTGKKRVFQEVLHSQMVLPRDVDQALSSGELFTQNYASMHSDLAWRVYTRLGATDTLHKMAASHGLGDRITPLGKTLASYAKTFEFKAPKISGWRRPKTGTPYHYVTEPRRDKELVGIGTYVDLLIPEFGQDVDSIEEFIDIFSSRLEQNGWDFNTKVENDVIEVEGKWESFIVDSPRGGKVVMFFRKHSDELVIYHEVILLGDEHLANLEKYRKAIVVYLNTARLESY